MMGPMSDCPSPLLERRLSASTLLDNHPKKCHNVAGPCRRVSAVSTGEVNYASRRLRFWMRAVFVGVGRVRRQFGHARHAGCLQWSGAPSAPPSAPPPPAAESSGGEQAASAPRRLIGLSRQRRCRWAVAQPMGSGSMPMGSGSPMAERIDADGQWLRPMGSGSARWHADG